MYKQVLFFVVSRSLVLVEYDRATVKILFDHVVCVFFHFLLDWSGLQRNVTNTLKRGKADAHLALALTFQYSADLAI